MFFFVIVAVVFVKGHVLSWQTEGVLCVAELSRQMYTPEEALGPLHSPPTSPLLAM